MDLALSLLHGLDDESVGILFTAVKPTLQVIKALKVQLSYFVKKLVSPNLNSNRIQTEPYRKRDTKFWLVYARYDFNELLIFFSCVLS